jgi:hypothetical protein
MYDVALAIGDHLTKSPSFDTFTDETTTFVTSASAADTAVPKTDTNIITAKIRLRVFFIQDFSFYEYNIIHYIIT